MPLAPSTLARPPRAARRVETRPTACRRGYDRQWRNLAAAVLSGEPLCRPCKAAGLVTDATLVDHVTPIKDGGERLDEANLQPLCVKCHAKKTRADLRKRVGA